MARKAGAGICFPCSQQTAPSAQWQRLEAFGKACIQCGERPQGLFVQLVGSQVPPRKQLAKGSGYPQEHECADFEQLEKEELERAILKSLQPTSRMDGWQELPGRTSTSMRLPSPSSHGSTHEASSLPWLADWLTSVGLPNYFEKAKAWCDLMGVASTSEILENLDDFSKDLQLSNSDRECLAAVQATSLQLAASSESQLVCTSASSALSSTSSHGLPHDASNLPWLADWLASVGLHNCFQEAAAWCDSMGAVDVGEMLENFDDFMEHLQLSEPERERFSSAQSPSLKLTSSSDVSEQKTLGVSASSAISMASSHEPLHEASNFPWLQNWLESVGLHDYSEEAAAWCDSMGAADESEILENLDDFVEHLNLSDSDKERLSAISHASEFEASLAEAANPCDDEHEVAKTDHTAEGTAYGVACGATPSGPDDSTTFGPADAQYRILEQLGRGATATVYKCQRGAEVFAAKAIDLRRIRMLGNSNQVIAMLSREISLLQTLNHRKIVRLHEVVDTPSMRFLVMDLVDGGDLLNHILSQGGHGLPETESRHVFVQIIDGLRYIHSQNVVHRDLKPDNILIDSKASGPGLPDIKLSDFGFSKQIRDGYTRPHTILGTPQYWAPEVAVAGGSTGGYDERADLWSLGIVLHVMLTAKYPPIDGKAVKQSESFAFRGSRETEELVRGLIRLQPGDRLSLEQCLECPWLADITAQSMCSGPKLTREPSARHVLFRLPCVPADVDALKADLMSYSCSRKLSVNLHVLDVNVRLPHGSSESLILQTRNEVLELLVQHVPEMKKHDQGEPSPTPLDEACAEECESLGAIYGEHFEAISSREWKIQVEDGIIVHIYLPTGYPHTQPPVVDVECPMQVLPAGLTTSLHEHWTAGSVCVYQWIELIRERLSQALPPPQPEDVDHPEDVAHPEDVEELQHVNPKSRGARGQQRHGKKFTKASLDDGNAVEIQTTEPLKDRKSVFQAHGARVSSPEQVEWVWRKLLMEKKIANAQHNFVAFRYHDGEQKPVEDCDSDQEDGAGRMLAHLLEQRSGVFIMVSRWYGGQELGSDRHKNMRRAAIRLLEEMEPRQRGSAAKPKAKRQGRKEMALKDLPMKERRKPSINISSA